MQLILPVRMLRVRTIYFNDLEELLWSVNATNGQLVKKLHCRWV